MLHRFIGAVVFLCGFFHEVGCVFWVAASERQQAWRATLYSVICGTVGVVGVYFSIDDMRYSPFLIAGYGIGTLVAVKFKSRFLH